MPGVCIARPPWVGFATTVHSSWRVQQERPMTTTSSPVYRWRIGEIEITRVLEFEAALFEPHVIYPEAPPDIIDRHRAWLEPGLMDPAGRLLVFAFHGTVIRTPR